MKYVLALFYRSLYKLLRARIWIQVYLAIKLLCLLFCLFCASHSSWGPKGSSCCLRTSCLCVGRVSHGSSLCSSIHYTNMYLFIATELGEECRSGRRGGKGHTCGGRAREHRRVETWESRAKEKGRHELECRMGPDFGALFLDAVLNGSLGVSRRNTWSNTSRQAVVHWQPSGLRFIPTHPQHTLAWEP